MSHIIWYCTSASDGVYTCTLCHVLCLFDVLWVLPCLLILLYFSLVHRHSHTCIKIYIYGKPMHWFFLSLCLNLMLLILCADSLHQPTRWQLIRLWSRLCCKPPKWLNNRCVCICVCVCVCVCARAHMQCFIPKFKSLGHNYILTAKEAY